MKISNRKKRNIRFALMEAYLKKHNIEGRRKEVTELAQAILDNSYNEEVREFRKNNSNFLSETGSTLSLCNLVCQPYTPLYPSNYTLKVNYLRGKYIFDSDAENYLSKFERIREYVKPLVEDMRQAKILNDKILCVLNGIKTSQQLKNEFPEAYDFLNITNQEPNTCDTIENVRAQLNSNE